MKEKEEEIKKEIQEKKEAHDLEMSKIEQSKEVDVRNYQTGGALLNSLTIEVTQDELLNPSPVLLITSAKIDE